MPVNQQNRLMLAILLQPLLRQGLLPLANLIDVLAEQGDFAAQRFRLRTAVKPENLSPLPRCVIAQLFRIRDPGHLHQREKHQNRL